MPIYEYKCAACGRVADVQHGFRETHEAPCEHCGGAMVRVFTPAGIVFKGSGFYVNDSRAKKSESSSSKPAEGKSGESAPAASSDAGGAAASSPDSGTKSSPSSPSS